MGKKSRRSEDENISKGHRPTLVPRTVNQSDYIKAIRKNDITFGFGSAGSGKTFIATAMAAEAMIDGDVDRIVICRPAVEAGGDDLGYLPGTVNEKMDPYIRPMMDVLHSYWNPKYVQTLMSYGRIEVSPLAYMRGRTFHRAFVVADEMQNADQKAMLMLLTRLGEGSKMVVTGDPQQKDDNRADGFEVARRKLSGCPNVAFVTFGVEDVVRHPTVENVLKLW